MNKDYRILLIGPILPYRGGIAQHTTMLHRAMKGRVNAKTISFRRQYPGWLYPGESDKDPDYEGYIEPDVSYLLDSLNPYTWWKAIKFASAWEADLVVFPWWTIFWAPCFGFLAASLKRRGISILFLCHNVIEHESSFWKTWLTKRVLSRGTRFLVHTQEDKSNLQRLNPGARVDVHVHPIYDHYPAAKTHPEKRGRLELLFYGFVRPYKGMDVLIEAMGLLKDDDVRLTVAGEFWGGLEALNDKLNSMNLTNNVEVLPKYHTDQETAELFERCDLVILPYRSATGSGVVPVAYHYGKPVLVTRVGGLPDVVIHGKTGWIVPPEDGGRMAAQIRLITRQQIEPMGKNIEEIKATMSWESMIDNFLPQ